MNARSLKEVSGKKDNYSFTKRTWVVAEMALDRKLEGICWRKEKNGGTITKMISNGDNWGRSRARCKGYQKE